MKVLLSELRFARRRLARRPGIACAAIALLAVGLGGNFALVATLEAMLFRQPPVEDPERLVRIVRSDASHTVYDNWSFLDAHDLAAGANTLGGAAIYIDWLAFHLTPPAGEGLRLRGSAVDGGYFRLLGVRPALGRLIEEADYRAGAAVTVLGHDLWRNEFAADSGILGRPIRLNGQTVVVIGVAPRGLSSLDPTLAPRLWVPLTTWTRLLDGEPGPDLLAERGSSWLDLIGRLAPAATLAAAQTELDARLARLAALHPGSLSVESGDGVEPAQALVMPVDVARVGGPTEVARVERQATLVAVVSLLVLLAIAANLAGLLATRAAQARHETALRAALGAGRSGLALPLLAEGLLLVATGTAAAVPVAAGLARLARLSLGFLVPLATEDDLTGVSSPGAVVAAVGLVVLAVLIVAVVPGLAAARRAALPELRRQGRGRPGGAPLTDLLLGAQVALSIVLVALAGLLVARFRDLRTQEIGMEVEQVVQAGYDLGLQGYEPERAAAFHDQLLQRLVPVLGADGVALTDWTPMSGAWTRTSIEPEGYAAAAAERPSADLAHGTPGLFATLGMDLVAGRPFDEGDIAGAPPVAVINETMARRFFAGREPIGARFWRGSRERDPLTVVGVVRDARFRGLAHEVMPMFFRPLAQSERAPADLFVLARAGEPAAALGVLRAVLADLDPDLPLLRAGRLSEQVTASVTDERRLATLFTAFAALLLSLSGAGLAGLAASSVARRRREIGIRLALGAAAGRILVVAVGRVVLLVAAGAAAGLAIAGLLLPRLGELAGSTLRLSPALAFAAAAVLALTAIAATWLPAHRALRVDPTEALRAE